VFAIEGPDSPSKHTHHCEPFSELNPSNEHIAKAIVDDIGTAGQFLMHEAGLQAQRKWRDRSHELHAILRCHLGRPFCV
jgi:hypothetical protein